MMLLELMKVAGRKFSWSYAALFALWSLAALTKLDSAAFQLSFAALVGAVMAANYGEHKTKGGKDAPPQDPAPK